MISQGFRSIIVLLSVIMKNYSNNSPYECYSTLFPNGNLLSRRTDVYSSSIGVSTFYDLNGKVLKVKDYDVPYAFFIEDLANKMKKEYNLYIYDKSSKILYDQA